MNIYATVTDRILKQLEQGVVPWRKTWASGLPKSLTTGREYRGINILILGNSEFNSRYWVTYREAMRLGGHVRRGEKATTVIYWHWRTEKDLERLRQKTGKDDFAPCVPFANAVFNLEQVEGVHPPKDDIPLTCLNSNELADQVLAMMPDKPEITHARTDRACYNRVDDRVTLPHLGQFESAAGYYATLYHELAHATGHARRLNRFTDAQGDREERYSFEELVAEFGASFLCAHAGIVDPTNQALSASYIDGWATVFRKDNRILLKAASAAQRAADYIRGKIVLDEETSQAA